MVFQSLLFKTIQAGSIDEPLEAPAVFADLNVDQIVDAITAGKEEYDLKPFYYTALKDMGTVHYRHEIMKDLDHEGLFECLNSFAQKMREMRRYLDQAARLYYQYQKERWFLDAVEIYCQAVLALVNDLSIADLRSRGLLAFRDHAASYVESADFISLKTQIEKLKTSLSSITYCLQIKDNCIKVRQYAYESNYSAEVEATFARFKQGAVKDYRVNYSEWVEMNHVEARILALVAQLYPDIFLKLDEFYVNNAGYLDASIARFDREIQFYMAYLTYTAKFKRVGLKFCYPQISATSKEIYNYEGFDLALAHKLIQENATVICNDFYLRDQERLFIVSGPNQGGKTTFARTFGQLHYLASLGCPVPGRDAGLFLYDKLFTHFEKEENLKNLRGKLQDDLVRIYDILDQATPNSIIIMNEIFTSTTLKDAIILSEKIIKRVIDLDILCVWVTFIDELASFSEQTVSVVSTVIPENPAMRTYKIVRKPADGLAYAMSIAEKYRLTYEDIKERVKE